MSLPADTTVSDVLRWLSDNPVRVEELLERWEYGAHDEWDMGLRQAILLLGSRELALAARSASFESPW